MNELVFTPPPRILIIDDNRVIITFLEKFFSGKNFIVKSAQSGKEATDLCSKETFELALVDIMLPDVRGDELFRNLVDLNPGLIGIIITGNATIETAIKAVEAPGIVGYETKPFDMDRLSTIVREVISRRRAEESLRESEARYRTFVENFQGIAYRVDMDFNPEFFHGAVEEITGYTEAEFLAGAPSWNNIIIDKDANDAFTETVNKLKIIPNYSCEREYRIARKDGEICWINERIRNICDDSGSPVRIQSVIHDITDNKIAAAEKQALQLQLQHSQKMESVGRLAAGIAHDFNNILAAIMANASFGKENLTKKTFGYKQFDGILNASNMAKDLVSQMLTFARNDKPNIRSGSLNDVIRDSLSMVSGSLSKDINMEINLDETLPDTCFDSSQILQVVINLFNNARDAVGASGNISVSSASVELDSSFCARHVGLRPGEYCRITVRDDGEGIGKESFSNIFDPFFTTKDTGKGTGLGLSVTLGIVSSHGGIIEVESEPGKGTKIEVYLPVIPSV